MFLMAEMCTRTSVNTRLCMRGSKVYEEKRKVCRFHRPCSLWNIVLSCNWDLMCYMRFDVLYEIWCVISDLMCYIRFDVFTCATVELCGCGCVCCCVSSVWQSAQHVCTLSAYLQYEDKFGTCVCIRVYTHQATADIRAAEVKRGAESQLTIIGVTGATSKDDEIKCRKAGMTDIITKPVKREHLRTKIKEWVDKMEKVHFWNSKPSTLPCSLPEFAGALVC